MDKVISMRERNPFRRFLSITIAILVLSLLSLNIVKNLTIYDTTDKKVYGFFSMLRYGLIEYPVETFTNFTKDYASFWQQREVNDLLREELIASANWQVKEKEYLEEIASLKALNELDSIYTEVRFISGRIISRSFDSWNKVATINVGTQDGVEVGDAIMAAKGLIGKVVSVEANSATISLLSSNSDFTKVSVNIQTDGAHVNGIIHSYDTEKDAFKIQLMKNEKSVAPGQKIVTSGLGGTFPKGLYFGEVQSIETVATGVGLDIYAKSEVNFQGVDYVKVVKSP